LRSSSETGGSEGRNEIIAATIGGTFMADIVIQCVFCLDHGSLFYGYAYKANQNAFKKSQQKTFWIALVKKPFGSLFLKASTCDFCASS